MANPHANEIYVVDDDPHVLDALTTILTVEGFGVTGFSDGPSFVSAAQDSQPACVILDVNMPGMSGLDVLKQLKSEVRPLPVLAMSGQADIPMAVDAIRNGAIDFFEKPFDAGRMVDRIREVIASNERREDPAAHLTPSIPGIELLTPREREVLARIASGSSNKEAGRALGISPRTVEVHRARIMEKLNARNAADLVRIVLTEH